MEFGRYFKNRRMELGYTARKFAKEKGYEVSYISRLENELILPPKDFEKVEKLAKSLELEEGSEEWNKFFDLVSVARNEIPQDLHSDEMAVKMLPAFYRSLRNESLDKDEAEKLIELIEKSRKE